MADKQAELDAAMTDQQKRITLKSAVKKELVSRGFDTPILQQRNYDEVFRDVLKMRPGLASASEPPSIKNSPYDQDYAVESPGLAYARKNK